MIVERKTKQKRFKFTPPFRKPHSHPEPKFYKNDELVASLLFSGFGSTVYPLTIGNSAGGWNEFFDGIIDDVRIYNRALSDSEIQELYNEGT